MASTQLDIRTQVFGNNVIMLAQQKASKFFSSVIVKPNVTGKNFFQDRIGKWEMAAKVGVNPTTPLNDPELSRRMAYIYTKQDNRVLDRSLDLQALADPRSQMTQSASAAIGREMDSTIITQLIGSANYGEAGASTVALPSAQKIANGSAGLTFAKVRQAKQILDDADVDEADRFFALSPRALWKLLGEDEATSSDYAAIKALTNGEINTWMGFNWIKTTQLPVASNIRSCIAFSRQALCYGMCESPVIKVSERPDLSYSTQIYYEINHGAVRLEEEQVVQVDIDETAT